MPPLPLPSIESRLEIRGLIASVSLGVGDEERSRPQDVRFDVALRFRAAPRAVKTDHLDDTACYHEVTRVITRVCALKPYHLIEHLGTEVYQAVAAGLPEIDLLVKITKLHPPIPGLTEGVSFAYGDARLRPL